MDFDTAEFHDIGGERPDWTPVFARLFPDGLAGADVIRELAPEGWAISRLAQVFHPSAERLLDEALALHRNLQNLPWSKGAPDASPEPTLESVMASYRETPIEAVREVGELVAMCLWDVFSDNHEVVTEEGQRVDIGWFRGAAGFLADFLDGSLGTRRYGYMDFYMGTIWVHGRADLLPVYELIFRRLESQGLEWVYHFPRLELVDLRPLRESLDPSGTEGPEWEGYSPCKAIAEEEEAAARELEINRMRQDLDEAHAEAVLEARHKSPPRTVEAYKKVYGRFPPGWPPGE